ncbi:hypothetical protein [Nocardia brasiliensis]|uniref:hypothetical protein n=1 Tax=Nocardia brasiliensis TaxID=37326 RepID=UPI0024550DA4|nr:hypothetical protein [Nocardia brasiliensis]
MTTLPRLAWFSLRTHWGVLAASSLFYAAVISALTIPSSYLESAAEMADGKQRQAIMAISINSIIWTSIAFLFFSPAVSRFIVRIQQDEIGRWRLIGISSASLFSVVVLQSTVGLLVGAALAVPVSALGLKVVELLLDSIPLNNTGLLLIPADFHIGIGTIALVTSVLLTFALSLLAAVRTVFIIFSIPPLASLDARAGHSHFDRRRTLAGVAWRGIQLAILAGILWITASVDEKERGIFVIGAGVLFTWIFTGVLGRRVFAGIAGGMRLLIPGATGIAVKTSLLQLFRIAMPALLPLGIMCSLSGIVLTVSNVDSVKYGGGVELIDFMLLFSGILFVGVAASLIVIVLCMQESLAELHRIRMQGMSPSALLSVLALACIAIVVGMAVTCLAAITFVVIIVRLSSGVGFSDIMPAIDVQVSVAFGAVTGVFLTFLSIAVLGDLFRRYPRYGLLES